MFFPALYIIAAQTASKQRAEPCSLILFSHPKVPLLPLQVHSLDGASNIGSIIRKWNGFLSTMANADHFEICFPLDLDVKMKAMIFGACFLIVSLLLWTWENYYFLWWEAVFYSRQFILKLGQLLSVPLLGTGWLGSLICSREKNTGIPGWWIWAESRLLGHTWKVSGRQWMQ